MRLAVFTNQFPGRLATFFASDLQALAEAGVDLEVFAIRPPEPDAWRHVPPALAAALPRARVHHPAPGAALRARPRAGAAPGFARDAAALAARQLRHGPAAVAKTAAAALLGWHWGAARRAADGVDLRAVDHVLAYWGNHAATCAWLAHRLSGTDAPFSMLVHARMDLYRQASALPLKLRHADNVFTVCEYNRDYLRDRFPALFPALDARLHLHHIGVPLDRLAFSSGARPPARLVTVGRLEPLKGVEVLLRAIARLGADHGPVALDVVGGGAHERRLRAEAARLGVADRVRFRGWQDAHGTAAAMRGATILVHPSVRPDAMPTVLKEALALGTPVVASRLAGIPEILDDGRCGVLVPPGDDVALAAALRALLADAPRRRALAERGRRHAEALFDARANGRRLAERLAATPRRRTTRTVHPVPAAVAHVAFAAAPPAAAPPAAAAAPRVSVVVPCRNERAHVAACVRSLLDGGHPRAALEVIVVDGMSDDGTRDVLAALAATHPEVRVLDNPRRITPAALNLGVSQATGEVICIAGAHSVYPPGYVTALAARLADAGADAAGGVCRTEPADFTVRARAIAAVLAHPFGVGNAHFRIGAARPRWVDTAAFACYRRDVFARIGGFDETLARNQDDEFNGRLRRRGGRILLVPDVVVRYRARATFGALWRMQWQYGRYKPLVIRRLGHAATWRQLAPGSFVAALAAALLAAPWSGAGALALAALVGAYGAGALAGAAQIARRAGPAVGLAALAAFPVVHVAYGTGFLAGVLALARPDAARALADPPLSR